MEGSDQHAERVYQFLRNWALVISVIVGGFVIIVTALLVVGWPVIASSHFGYSTNEVMKGETIWSYVWLGWVLLLTSGGTAFMITWYQVSQNAE